MKRVGLFCVASAIVALASSTATWGRDGVHTDFEHREYHRELDHREVHRYPMTGYQHNRLHDALEHEAYHDRLEHRAIHRHPQHYRPPVYHGHHDAGYGHSTYVTSPARGLGISTPRFSFWIAK